MASPCMQRLTGNRFNRSGQVVRDRRAYYDWGDDYEAGMPLRPPRKSSPARVEFKTRRRQARTHLQPKAA